MRRGFTLLELLIVIAIIGILSATVLVAVNSARQKANDARRKSDLAQIERALQLYYDKYGNYMESESGCGGGGGVGNGYFNSENGVPTSYPRAMSNCLVDEKFTPAEIIDPTGKRGTGGYMKYSCTQGTYIYAHLETEPDSTTATDGTCNASLDSSYGMNYYRFIPR